MDKRALIGIGLSILVLVVYQQVVTYFYGPPPTVSAPEVEKNKPETAEPRENSTPIPPTVAPPTSEAAVAAVSAKEITVETENYRAVFTTAGARLKSFKFKKYRSSVDEKSPPFEMIRNV
ncbi:MAG: membrane protein insertase YidC, partial [Betaproteobacteria bacterium]